MIVVKRRSERVIVCALCKKDSLSSHDFFCPRCFHLWSVIFFCRNCGYCKELDGFELEEIKKICLNEKGESVIKKGQTIFVDSCLKCGAKVELINMIIHRRMIPRV